MLEFLNVWYHPGFHNFIIGLQLSSFIVNLSKYSSALLDMSNIWNCNIKKVLHYNYCNYKANLLSIFIFVIVTIIIILIGKFVLSKYNTDRHKIIYNHINNIYWLFAFVIYFAAYDAPTPIFIFIAILLIIVTLVLWYQSIKNIFTITYA
jgi:hypothetical protein